MRSNAVPRSASAPFEDSTGASHVVEGGVRVEIVKIESDPNFNIGSSSETSSARSCRCRAVQSTVQLPFPENGASLTGISSPTFRPMGAASRKSPKNPKMKLCSMQY